MIHRTVTRVGLFAIICGVVAFLYLLYRILLVAFPVAIMGAHYISPHPEVPSCVTANEINNTDLNKEPYISRGYQQMVKATKPLGPNLVSNPTIVPPVDGQFPEGYEPTVQNDTATYSSTTDPDGTRYLHTTNTQKVSTDTAMPGWVTDPIAIQNGATYAYDVAYRSQVPLRISLELQTQGKPRYQLVTGLAASDKWQNFTAHYANSEGAESMRIVVTADAPGGFDLKNFDVHQIAPANLSHGIVTISFDDGWQSFYDKALPIVRSYGMRTSQFIVANFSDQKTPGYMDSGKVVQLQNEGHEIGSHSLYHCDQAKLDSGEVQNDAAQSRQLLEKHGIKPIKSYAYPHGSYNAQTQQVIPREYSLVRTSDAGYNDRYFDNENIRAMGITHATTAKELQGWLQYAAEKKVWLVLTYHRVDESGEYSSTSHQLREQLDLIKKSKLEVLTLSEAAHAIRQ